MDPVTATIQNPSPAALRQALDAEGAMRALAGNFAQFGSIEGIRAAAPLPRHAEEVLDAAVVGVGRQRLVLVDDLLNAGLIYRLDNFMSVMQLTYQRTGEVGYAQRTMIPSARGERQMPDREYASLPIYLTWDDFSFGIRTLLEAERVGAPLDTTLVEQATRRVNEAFEDQAFNGAGIQINGLTAPGALTNPVNTSNFTGSEAWDNAGHTGEEIVSDILAMQDVSVADNYYGPWNVYIPRGYGSKMAQDYKAASDSTILQRALEIPGINAIKVADYLPANTVLMVQMTSNVVDVVLGQTPTQVSWTDGPGWNRFWCVLGCLIVRWKADSNGGVGYVVGTPS